MDQPKRAANQTLSSSVPIVDILGRTTVEGAPTWLLDPRKVLNILGSCNQTCGWGGGRGLNVAVVVRTGDGGRLRWWGGRGLNVAWWARTCTVLCSCGCMLILIAFQHLGCWRSCADVEAVMLRLIHASWLSGIGACGVDSG
jgi:hypothetical protein